MNKSKHYKKLRNDLATAIIGQTVSYILVLHPIIWIIIGYKTWISILTTIVLVTIGTMLWHVNTNNLDEATERMNNFKDMYAGAMKSGVDSEVFCTGIDLLVKLNSLGTYGQLKIEFGDTSFRIIDVDTGEEVVKGEQDDKQTNSDQ